MHQNINDSKPHIWSSSIKFSVFGIKSQSQQKHSKNLIHFTNLNSLNINKNIVQQHSQKPYSLYRFSNKHDSGCCQKEHLHCTISRCPRNAFLKHLERNVSCQRNVCSREVTNFYQVGVWITCLRRVAVWGLWNFHFNWNFWKCSHFSEFW